MEGRNIVVERAADADIDAVAALYDHVNDHLAATVNYNAPSWARGVYPVRDTAVEAHSEGSLYVARSGGAIAGSFILNRRQNPDYIQVPWGVNARDEAIWVIHTLVIHPAFRGCGVAKRLIDFAIAHGKHNNAAAVRVDTFRANAPAQALYSGMGFTDKGEWYTFDTKVPVRMYEYLL